MGKEEKTSVPSLCGPPALGQRFKFSILETNVSPFANFRMWLKIENEIGCLHLDLDMEQTLRFSLCLHAQGLQREMGAHSGLLQLLDLDGVHASLHGA